MHILLNLFVSLVIQLRHWTCYQGKNQLKTIAEVYRLKAGVQSDTFQGRGGFVKLGHFDKHFIKKSRKKSLRGKMFEVFFSQVLLKLYFEWQIQPRDGHNQGFFFQSKGSFFDFQKRAGEVSPFRGALHLKQLKKNFDLKSENKEYHFFIIFLFFY